MQITTEELFAEAGALALELRLKDKALRLQEQGILQLRARIAELEGQQPAQAAQEDGKPADPPQPRRAERHAAANGS
jgi:hypothetical protein